jgi:hypothetical protein
MQSIGILSRSRYILFDRGDVMPRHYFVFAIDFMYVNSFPASNSLTISRVQDKLMMHPPTWFSSLVVIELVFQVPFFFLAVYAIARRSNDKAVVRGDGVFRSMCMIYGSSTATTLIPIFASILTQRDTTVAEKGVLLCFYLPYIIFPLWLVVIAVCEEDVFGKNLEKKRK